MEIPREIDLPKMLSRKSCFLFGPRQTGKTWLIENQLKGVRHYDLLDSEVFLSLSRNQKKIEQELRPGDKLIVIDEIQKLPALLDEVHRLIEKRKITFLLTGSNARKLRRKGVNLLGGRAIPRTLHPFVKKELGVHFDLMKALNYGTLPGIYFSEEPAVDLQAYIGTYLTEEIAAEGTTRNIPAFSRFLEIAGTCNSQMINYSSISNDAQVPRTTIYDYFQILRDTLIGNDLSVWKHSIKRKPISVAKFYFFDIGVARALQHRSKMHERSSEVGEAFESYIHHELSTYLDYNNLNQPHYWRSQSSLEVDFIMEDITAIEVKVSSNITAKDLSGLKALREEQNLKNYLIVSREKTFREVDGIKIFPWEEFLDLLWEGEFLN